MNVYNDFINEYITELKKDYISKNYDILNNSHKTIFQHKGNNSYLSLKDILLKKELIKSSLIQNEINSINEIQKDKFIIFKTTTLNPILNLNNKFFDIEGIEKIKLNQEKDLKDLLNIHSHNIEDILINKYGYREEKIKDLKDKQNKELQSFKNKQDKELYKEKYFNTEEKIKEQYEEFNKYFKYISNMNDKKNLKYKNIRIYELTQSLNIHSHKIDLLNNQEDFIKYIESLFLSRNKFNIGRVELVLDFEFFKVVEKFFKDKKIKVRINNKYTFLTLIKKTIKEDGQNKTIHYIKETKKGEGNFIYFRTIEKQDKDDKDHITKYLFKYMLKTFDLDNNKNISKETLIFSKLLLKQKIYSLNFYTDKINKEELEKLNNRFFTYFKMKENNKKTPLDYLKKEDYEYIMNNKNSMFYTLSTLLNNETFIINKNNVFEEEYKTIKSLVIETLKSYDYLHISNLNEYFKNDICINDEIEYKIIEKEKLEEQLKEELDYNVLVEKLTQSVFNYYENKYTLLNNIDYEDNHLIDRLTQSIFKFFVNKFKYSNDKEVIYINNEICNVVKKETQFTIQDIIDNKDLEDNEQIYLPSLIQIHSFKSNYEFNKYEHDIELNYTLLTEDFNFNNEQEKLKTYIDLINSLNEHLEFGIDKLTLDKVQEEYKEEQEQNRKGKNDKLENLIENNHDEEEFKNGLLNYYHSLSEEEKLKYYNEQDENIRKLLLK